MKRWFHPTFETDLIVAARYLEARRMGFGVQLLEEVEAKNPADRDARNRPLTTSL